MIEIGKEIDVDDEVHLKDLKEVVQGKGQEKFPPAIEGNTNLARGVAKTIIVIEINKGENGPIRRLKNDPRLPMNLQENEHWYVKLNCTF